MANPQLENGYTRVANELLDALARTSIPGNIMQVVIVVIRKTYGYNKKKDQISISQFCEATGIQDRSNIRRALKLARRIGVVTADPRGVTDDPRTPATYSIAKDYNKWHHGVKHDLGSKNHLPGVKDDLKQGSRTTPTKDNNKRQYNKHLLNGFEILWDKYPNKDGKKDALRHYKSSVKNKEDFELIKLALKNYLQAGQVQRGFVKAGKTWFYNWTDWVDYKPKPSEARKMTKKEAERFVNDPVAWKEYKKENNL